MVLKKINQYQIGKTLVYFVRHGDRIHMPANPNAGFEVPGPALNKLGKKQAKDVANKFAKIKDEIDVIYCSPMTRAIETSKEIEKRIGKKAIRVYNFHEICSKMTKDKLFTKKYWKSYIHLRRAKKELDKILIKNKGKVIIIVAHGALNKFLIMQKLGISLEKGSKFDYHNCHISLVRFNGTKLDYIHYFNSKELV